MREDDAPLRLLLDDTHAIQVTTSATGRHAEPVTASGDAWRRATAGDGSGLALLRRLRTGGGETADGFRVAAYAEVVPDDRSERAMGVDQTHESWVVGGRLVVKWMTEPLVGPHPAADRLRRLSAAGFTESPELVGLVEWREPGAGHWIPVAVVQSYLPGTEDGWTWALDEARRSLGLTDGRSAGFGADVGDVVGRLHLALADHPQRRMDPGLAQRYADEALAAFERARAVLARHDPASFALVGGHRAEIEGVLAGLAESAGTPVLAAHGDLHVGQVLRGRDGRYAVVDFDGNPTIPADLRAAPAPAARDVAQLLASLENVEHVVRHYAPELSDEAGRAWTEREQTAFIGGYRRALGGDSGLYDERLLQAYDWEQVCREIVYAGERDFTEWLYVPAAQLRRRLVGVA